MKTLITAHSGCENTPPNSRAFIETALSTGCDMLEIDLNRDGDRLYLSHDRADPAECLSFEDFLDLLEPHPGVRVNCDMKEDGCCGMVMRAANRRGMAPQIVFTGSAHTEEAEIRSSGGEFWYGIWDPDHLERAIASCLRTGAKIINLQSKIVTEETKARLDGLGLGFSCWTIDKEPEMRRLLTLGIYNITTRKPILAMKLRDEIQGGAGHCPGTHDELGGEAPAGN